MKLNKILMSTLVGCSLLTPVILSSCSIKKSGTSSNDEEQKPKTIPVPFQSSLYDTWSPGDNFLVFSSAAKTTYEIPNLDEWLNNELNNGRNFKHEEEINVTLKFDSFSYSSNFIGSSDPPPFKIVNDFYSWIKSENNYEIYLLNVHGDNGDKLFKFSTFNWDFITNPNCYVYIYIYFWTQRRWYFNK
ncbi:hypothetical protein [Malacoplasma muris]|uniref:hypothetical protein n=1 Tax=Malacoplasma muris TaxID=2119 RepID=UPI00398E5BFB